MSESFTYENLFAGSQKPPVNREGTVRLGQAWSRGTLVGKLTSTQKWQLVDFDAKANFDDFGVTAEDIDTTEGEKKSTFYVEGEFNRNAVIIGYSDDADDWIPTLDNHGIYLRAAISTAGV